ncbi:PQQ-binding-like beta-propeller repeat protein [Brachybacterium sp. J144]|uniref:outer membrane protein assembly factor BamB family protein n=1 Tax=Brachybacterium sp. J144 TaxID=3116487 RepID=UPI002E762FB9|nr:PQQ-binding-like beta-propeller repeat protein [Brachybacterium sp. J144]MEE1649982.1 PQQ-binding-like beta-propeller repeat protein [Brachybacterium sp. J144]
MNQSPLSAPPPAGSPQAPTAPYPATSPLPGHPVGRSLLPGTPPDFPSSPPQPAPAAPPRRRRWGLLIAIGVVALVVLLVLIATGVLLATRVIGAGSGGGVEGYVETIRAEPEEAWSYEMLSRSDLARGDTTVASTLPLEDGGFVVLRHSTSALELGRISVVDGDSGEVRWEATLGDLGLVDEAGTPLLAPLSAEGHLTIAVPTNADETGPLHLVSLDPGSGSVVSSAVLEDRSPIIAHWTVSNAYGAYRTTPTPLLVGRPGGVERLSTGDLGGEPIWAANIGDIFGASLYRDHLILMPDEGGELWLDPATGYEPQWFTDDGVGTSYLPIDDSLVLRSVDQGGYTSLEGLDASGTILWSEDTNRWWTASGPDGTALFVAEDSADGGAAYLMRLDPRTGEELWEREHDDSFEYLEQYLPGRAVVLETERGAQLLDARTGEPSHRLRGYTVALAAGVVYTYDAPTLRAWDASSGDELWSLRVRDSAYPSQLGDMIVLVDDTRGTLTRLR